MKTTLERVSRLYDLVAEMREIIKNLHEMNVEVKISHFYSGYSDPLNPDATIMVMMRPGCDLVEKK